MRGRLFLFIVGLVMLPIGWNETKIAYKYREPVKMTCQQFIDATDKPSWVSVDDCVVYLGHYQTMTKKDGSVTSMAVMVFPSNEAARDDKTLTSVVLKISDSAKRDAVKDNLEKLNALGEKKDPATFPEARDRYNKLFETGPLVLKEDTMNEDFNLIKDKLNPQHMTYVYSSEQDKSSILKGVLLLLGGLACCVFSIGSFFWRRK